MRREILKISAGWVLCAAAWAACGGEQTVTNKELGFEIKFPGALKVEENLRKYLAVRAATTDYRFMCDLRVFEVREGIALNAFVASRKRDIGAFGNFAEQTKGDVKLGTLSATRVDYSFDAKPHTTERYFCIVGQRGFELCLKGDLDKHAKEIDAIVASFKVIEAK